MSIEEDLRKQLTAALKAKDSQTANLVRMIITKVTERRTAKDFKGEVDDALVLDVISSYKKAMEKAIKEYEALGERGAAEAKALGFEVNWCAGFLPTPLTDDELRAAVKQVIAEGKITDAKQAGRIIGSLKKLYGDRVDPQLAKQFAEAELGG